MLSHHERALKGTTMKRIIKKLALPTTTIRPLVAPAMKTVAGASYPARCYRLTEGCSGDSLANCPPPPP